MTGWTKERITKGIHKNDAQQEECRFDSKDANSVVQVKNAPCRTPIMQHG
jgi:hypothetical protein